MNRMMSKYCLIILSLVLLAAMVSSSWAGRPEVYEVSPGMYETDVLINAQVNVKFTEDVVPATIDLVLATGGNNVSGTVSYDSNQYMATFVPSSLLNIATTYTMKVDKKVESVSTGQKMLQDYVWNFTTTSDGIAPTVTSVSPSDGEIRVRWDSQVEVTFSESIDISTIGPSTFKVSTEGSQVTGTYLVSDCVATFVPEDYLVPGGTYSVEVNSGVKDMVGNPLDSTFNSSFVSTEAGGGPVVISGDRSNTMDVHNSLMIDQNGDVWAFGSNFYGQLGQGSDSYEFGSAVPVKVPGISNIFSVCAGSGCSFAVDAEGKLYAWGNNSYGKLGLGTGIGPSMPTEVTAVTALLGEGEEHKMVVEVASTPYASFVLLDDGTVWSWGYNNRGQLGHGDLTQSLVPVQVLVSENPDVYLTDIVDIAADAVHTLAVDKYGNVWGWGENYYGELGDIGHWANQLYAIQVPGISDVISVGAGYTISTALTAGGDIYTWGRGGGTLGRSGGSMNPTPAPLTGLSNVVEICVGTNHSLALLDGGTVWGWGNNYEGELGNGETAIFFEPAQINGLDNIKELAAGHWHSLFIRDNVGIEELWATGRNYEGQLGIPQVIQDYQPLEVVGGHSFEQVSANGRFALALDGSGQVWAWGRNSLGSPVVVDYGMLGDGTGVSVGKPQLVPGLGSMVGIRSAEEHAFVWNSAGNVWSWGFGTGSGIMGDGLVGDGSSPVQVQVSAGVPLEGVVKVVSEIMYALSLDANGWVYGWGTDVSGEFGSGSGVTNYNFATRIDDTWGPLGGTVTDLAAGYGHSAVLVEETPGNGGRVWTWGAGTSGQLGNGSTISATSPQAVQVCGSGLPLEGIVKVYAYGRNTYALDNNGQLWSWGQGSFYSLGNGTTTDLSCAGPVKVDSDTYLANVYLFEPSLGGWAAQNDSGTTRLYTWGFNNFGQMGAGEDQGRYPLALATEVLNLNYLVAGKSIRSIGGGVDFSIIVVDDADGKAYSLGSNRFGQLGDGRKPTVISPEKVQ